MKKITMMLLTLAFAASMIMAQNQVPLQPVNNNTNNTATNVQQMPCAQDSFQLLISDWNGYGVYVGCKNAAGGYQVVPFYQAWGTQVTSFYSLPQYRTLWAVGNSRLLRFYLDPTGQPAQVGHSIWKFQYADLIQSADWNQVTVYSFGDYRPQSYTVTTDNKVIAGELDDNTPYFVPTTCGHTTLSKRGDRYCLDNNKGDIWQTPAQLMSGGPIGPRSNVFRHMENAVTMAVDGNRLYVLVSNKYVYSDQPQPPGTGNSCTAPQGPTATQPGKLVRIDLDPATGDFAGQKELLSNLNIDGGLNSMAVRNGQVFFTSVGDKNGRQIQMYDESTGQVTTPFTTWMINPGGAFVGGMGFLR